METNLQEIRRQTGTMEFLVDGSFVQKLPEILSNVKELKAFAEEQTRLDRQLVLVTDDDFKAAQSRCADINKVITDIEGKRKQIKRAYMKPYDTLETALKEVTHILSTARENLWSQIQTAENAIKTEKEEKLRAYWENKHCECRAWEQVFNPKWLNKTAKLKDVFGAMDDIEKQCESDIATIKSVCDAEVEKAAIYHYKQGATLNETLSYAMQYRAELDREKEAGTSTETKELEVEQPKTAMEEAPNEETFAVDFRVYVTTGQLAELKKFLIAKGIRYGRVDR